jgi:regulator of nucleoside diphosphate kinase
VSYGALVGWPSPMPLSGLSARETLVNTNTTTSAITALPPIRMTIWNFSKLDSLLTTRADERSWRVDALLARELKRSIVMDDSQIPSDVATMRSRVEFRIEGTGLTQISTLAYPGECHTSEDAISVLTPLGSAILGLSEGQSIYYGGPDGTSVEVTMLRILYQPEAARRRGAERVYEAFSGLQLQSV